MYRQRLTSAFALIALTCILPTTWLKAGPPLPHKKPGRSIQLKTPLDIVVSAKQAFRVDLRNYLSDPGVPFPGNPQYQWHDKAPAAEGGASTLPSGVRLDGDFITGTVATAGKYPFRLTVKDKTPEGTVLYHRCTLTVLPPPPKFKNPEINLGVQPERTPWETNVKNYLEDPSLSVTFSVKGLRPWMNFDTTTGRLWGTPQRPDVGSYTGIQFTVIGQSGSDTATAHGLVQKVPVAPQWSASSIDLPDVDEESPMSANTMQYVLNPEGFPLEFVIVDMTPPPWLQIGKTTGTLFGTPADPGHVEVIVTLSVPGEPYTSTTTFKFNVKKINHAPQWKAKPIVLEPCYTGKLCTAKLGPSVIDPDGDKLKFSMTGPDWMKINADTGEIQGTPGKSNLGANTWTVKAIDPGNLSDTTEVKVTVIKSNEGPVWKNHPTVIEIDAYEDKAYQVDLSPYVTDPDGDEVFFTILAHPAQGTWASIVGDKILAGTPKRVNVGSNSFRIRVSDHKSGQDDVSDVIVMVYKTNHAPYWTLKPIGKQHPEEQPLNIDLSGYAKDDDGDKLTFSKGDGAWPEWVEISPEGKLSGTPQMKHEGLNAFSVRATDPEGLFADNRVEIEVTHVNHAPKWSPIPMLNAKEDVSFNYDISPYASDADLPNDELRFEKVSSTPAWISVSSKGVLTGTPGKADAGKTQSFQVRVLDKANKDAVTTVQVTVEKTNHAPEWLANPIQLTDGFESKPYKFDLQPFATDPDAGDKLSFSLVSGPEWMAVSSTGQITGTPGSTTAGNYEAEFTVTDLGGLTANTKGKLTIKVTPQAPQIDPSMPTFEVKVRETRDEDLKQWVTDPKGQKLTFTLLPTQGCNGGWVTLSSEGAMSLKPIRENLGEHACNFKVANAQLFTLGVLKIKVLPNPRPPYWLTEPITEEPLSGKTNTAFAGNIKDRAKDPDNLPLTFSRLPAGPQWLQVDAKGNLSGTPTGADLGENTFTLKVCNTDELCKEGTLVIDVLVGTQTDVVQVDTPVLGAPAENLWVIDNSHHCDKTIQKLKQNIGIVYDDLKNAGVNFGTVMLSADAKEFKGQPITNPGEKYLLSHELDKSSWVTSFNNRLGQALSEAKGWCHNCFNSPIWSMYLFYDSLPNIGELYHNGYVMPGVPADTMIVTHQKDHYKKFTKGTALQSYGPEDFLRDYLSFHKREQKVLRISAIAPECGEGGGLIETSGEPATVAPANAYGTLVNGTKGQYFPTKCNFDIVPALHKFASQVILRAYIHAKHRVPLTKTPLDPATITVKLGGVAVPADKWKYDSSRNEIQLYWHLIDDGTVKPGDKLEITYRVS
jgi:hypothetical protein